MSMITSSLICNLSKQQKTSRQKTNAHQTYGTVRTEAQVATPNINGHELRAQGQARLESPTQHSLF